MRFYMVKYLGFKTSNSGLIRVFCRCLHGRMQLDFANIPNKKGLMAASKPTYCQF